MLKQALLLFSSVNLLIVTLVTIMGACAKKDTQTLSEGAPPSLSNAPGRSSPAPEPGPIVPPSPNPNPKPSQAQLDLDGIWTSQCLTQFSGFAPHKMRMVIRTGIGYYKVYWYKEGGDCSDSNLDRIWTSDEFSISFDGDAPVSGYKNINYTFTDGSVHYNIVGGFVDYATRILYEGNTFDAVDDDGNITDGSSKELRPTIVDYRIEYTHQAFPK